MRADIGDMRRAGGTGPAGAAAIVVVLLIVLARVLRSARAGRANPGAGGGRVVRADDGTRLHVEVDGDPDAPLTVVFVHGFTARLGEFDQQRDALRDRARLVLYDQRGHGRSAWGRAGNATFDQLGRDLAAVLEACAPTGPVVLLGHSMGGMTIMSLARQRPELFGDRVVGVFLLATSAGDLARTGLFGAWIRVLSRLHLLGLYLRWLRLVAPLVEPFRSRGTRTGRAFVRRYLFGRDDATPELVDDVQAMLEETPLTVTAAFYAAFVAHDEHATLPVLRTVPTTILVGTHDRLTPAQHSRRMADVIGNAELVVVPGTGHTVNITRPRVVNDAVLALVGRAEERARLHGGAAASEERGRAAS